MKNPYKIGALFGGHVRAVFSLVLVIFIFCVFTTLTSFNEIPLDVLTTPALRVSKLTFDTQRALFLFL